MSEAFAKRVFIISIAWLLTSFAFTFGLVVERYRIWPHETVHLSWAAAKSIVIFGELVPEGRRLVPPLGASRDTFKVYEPTKIGEGYYVFLGWDNNNKKYTAWLYDSVGHRLHNWSIDYLALDPDGPSNGSDMPHAFRVLRDGSIIVGFDEGDVMARLDPCSEAMWVKKGIYHHAISPASDGNYWAWRGDGAAYAHYNYLEKFNAETGETVREIGLVEDIIESIESSALMFGVRLDYPFQKFDRDRPDNWSMDIFHPNDVDELSADFAPFFKIFRPGDLLLSFRNLNLVVVVDSADLSPKWTSYGPWIGQHDPDFTSDGKISVYNNNVGRGRSEIVKMDPATRELTSSLMNGGVSFYSEEMGKHQYLPNGDVLIVVPGEGRVLEVTGQGDLVMEFNNVSSASAEYNEHVENGLWVSPDYFQSFPSCANRLSIK